MVIGKVLIPYRYPRNHPERDINQVRQKSVPNKFDAACTGSAANDPFPAAASYGQQNRDDDKNTCQTLRDS